MEAPVPTAAYDPPAPSDARRTAARRWTVARVGYLLVPFAGAWFTAAYLLPSPVGVLVPAVPYLALALAGAAIVLVYGLLRSQGRPRWSRAYRGTVAVGGAAGLVVAGLLGLSWGVVLGCPVLPPASTERPSPGGWLRVSAAPWKDGGLPVVYFFGATWCPYCSASSWAVLKALSEFGTVSGGSPTYSYGPPEPYAYTPEVDLSTVHLSSRAVAFEVSEYDGGTDGETPATSNCVQRAYVTAYDTCTDCGIPFLVVGGQYVHIGSLYDPGNLAPWNRTNDPAGAAYVESSVLSENGTPWRVVQTEAWWVMALLVDAMGQPVPPLALANHWSVATTSSVWADVNLTS